MMTNTAADTLNLGFMCLSRVYVLANGFMQIRGAALTPG